MKRANHPTVPGCLVLVVALVAAACSGAADGGLEPTGAGGGDAIALASGPGPADAAMDAPGRSAPPDRERRLAPAGAAAAGALVEDRPAEADRSRAAEEMPRSQRLLYRRLP